MNLFYLTPSVFVLLTDVFLHHDSLPDRPGSLFKKINLFFISTLYVGPANEVNGYTKRAKVTTENSITKTKILCHYLLIHCGDAK